MINFLQNFEHRNNSERTRVRGFFLLVIFFLIIIFGFSVSVEQYITSQWLNFAERLAGKISVNNWWRIRPSLPVVLLPTPLRPIRRVDAQPLDPTAFTGRHIVVRDNTTGEMLFGKAAYEPWPIASITKLLSALVLLETPLDFSATTTAAIDAVYDNDIVANQTYLIKDLWGASLVASSNRAILSLVDASGFSRTEFVERLNQKATQLGLTNTHIAEPTGLDPKNTSTAADIALLIFEAFKKPMIRDFVILPEYRISTVDNRFAKTLKTTDWLVSGIIPKHGLNIRGGKTGSIPESDYNFAFQVTSSTSHVVDIVVLGAVTNDARFVEARELAKWVYRSYEWK
ncbi:MAG: hypothetical protein A2821_04250 [Candidatus Magasanikbacteria bacterium RIFCSPHIGHO2_01_FULL_41_23]|uniref:Peptidase S11 D-alanyl-D-alanine carboxypeptidase A N-terminal domain-containing protein n=1 Tax=Candidatus Magasanikbacteria bacterium RIFCSPLOWO2_01_FULL_40_15 TaxID=1798686 RepID=A0A1F6N473_9BACT|nr:MAG: hypothetical protein A2821_04250 [Candidatus Magasanikbacteria bacterium RIFCSPHIGHO2_01_FULL_41_23]OGH67138.1 MAG: hypothetical protein A3C66_02565 [Candidatus Magasanikbacteria bacterium RIFCSPHIGHO2_02_FULL_41_35]OGH76726.1 MAG: hypothetical protein A3F22_03425 [Candidatus Magasanikbacteria bacterium RIFCSPHIGHO2_12_FULL_41_16]OGH78674.1 MAG: hypothetical protein A2983_04200 [Candidatus Magasanikbacteria bacterium RIFCSPLOWO2_01_FULL_40_15]